MSMINDYHNRQLVPRLLSFETSNVLSLNTISSKNNDINTFELNNYYKLRTEWKIEKNIILATQIILYEIIHDSLFISNELIFYLNGKRNNLNSIEKEILNIAIHKSDNKELLPPTNDSNDIKDIIRNLKISNNINPLNPLQWCNLGYYYTKIGLKEKAKKAFLISIGLNNNNRHIVRSVSRFFLHIGDIEFGHYLLTNSSQIKNDPNIISAEIAFSELIGKKSKFIDNGIIIKNDNNISIFEKNELLAQIATLEFSHGKNKKGKQLLHECLENPNENSLAQVAFLEKKHIIEPIAERKTTVSFQYEALARHYFNNANYDEAYNYSKLWYNFQPFTSYPAALSTYIAIEILNKYQEATDIAETALKISPESIILKNNLAFSYAKSNKISEAVNVINKINKNNIDAHDRAVLCATAGFIAFKQGNIEDAKLGYNEAINYFRIEKDEESLARALYNYSNILEKNEKEILLKEVLNLSNKYSINELIYLIEKKNDSL